jgi:hypothetical protein
MFFYGLSIIIIYSLNQIIKLLNLIGSNQIDDSSIIRYFLLFYK